MNKKVSIIVPVYNLAALTIRALNSIPARDDLEIIIVNDCSTEEETIRVIEYFAKTNDCTRVFHNEKNMGVSASINRGLDAMVGEYYLQLDNDDYFYPDVLNKVIDIADADLVWFNMETNNGNVWFPNISKEICDHSCLYRKSIIGNVRHPLKRVGSGWFFHTDIISKPHTERYTNEIAYHYNFPRTDSLVDLYQRGRIKDV